MSCWDILGISPTKNKLTIKKAYAHAAALHHPEEDPQGFQAVSRAYKEALAFCQSNSSITQNTDPEEVPRPTSENHQLPRANSSFQQFDMSLLIDCTCIPQREMPQANNSFDYDLEIQYGNSKENLKIDHVIENFYSIYLNIQKRNSISAWKKFFRSRSFLSLRRHILFTQRFLSCLSNHTDISAKVWNRAFVPVLKEWSLLWKYSEFQQRFNYLIQYKENRKDGSYQKRKDCIIVLLLFVLGIALIVILGWLDGTYHF